MAERFARGGRLIAFGRTPAARSDARHVAVEFVHPVIVGKRALPAIGLAGEGGPLARAGRLLAEPDDIAIGFGADEVARARSRSARERGCLTLAFAPAGAEWEFEPPAGRPVDPPGAGRDALPRALGARARVLRPPRPARGARGAARSTTPGASSFLYPFLGEQENDLEAVVDDVRRSVLAKAAEVGELRAQTLTENRDAAGRRGGRRCAATSTPAAALLALGNGGSATDAMDVVADFARRPAAARALDLTEDAAILTAIANDIGTEAIFARQVIAHGRAGDALLAISTSGNSANVIAALGRGAPARPAHDRAGRLRRRAGRGRGARRPRDRHALGAHPAHPGGAGERLPRAARAGRARDARGAARARGGHGPGRRLPALRLPARGRARAWPATCSTTRAGWSSRSRRRRRRSSASSPGCRSRRRRSRRSSGSPRSRSRSSASSASRSARARRGGEPRAAVTPDSATCADCLAELFDPGDRRFRYPFVNCTNCGPRFTIVRDVPYDRPQHDDGRLRDVRRLPARVRRPGRPPLPRPAQRLPGVRAAGRGWLRGLRRRRRRSRPRRGAARAGAIVAVKGIGGYHLACRADDEEAVARAARAQAPRGQAVRADGAATSRRRASWSSSAPAEEELLDLARRGRSCWRPRRAGRAVAAAVAPRSAELGVMLPYSPLHHLLLGGHRRARS